MNDGKPRVPRDPPAAPAPEATQTRERLRDLGYEDEVTPQMAVLHGRAPTSPPEPAQAPDEQDEEARMHAGYGEYGGELREEYEEPASAPVQTGTAPHADWHKPGCVSAPGPAFCQCAAEEIARLRGENELHLRDWHKLLLLIAEVCGEEDPESAVADGYDPWTALRRLANAAGGTQRPARLDAAREEGRLQALKDALAAAEQAEADGEWPTDAVRALAEGAANGKETT